MSSLIDSATVKSVSSIHDLNRSGVIGLSERGFSLIEVLTVIVVMGVILAIATPIFSEVIASTRMSSQANDLMADILYARSEAAARGVRVVICASTNKTSCSASSTDWKGGRIIFADANNNQTLDSNEIILQAREALAGKSALTPSGFNSLLLIRFNPFGAIEPLGTIGSFKLCPSAGKDGRQIAIALNGRPAVTRISTCP